MSLAKVALSLSLALYREHRMIMQQRNLKIKCITYLNEVKRNLEIIFQIFFITSVLSLISIKYHLLFFENYALLPLQRKDREK